MATSAIAGYYGFGNAGDELILHALIRRLKAENHTERIIVLSHKPADTLRVHGVDAVQRWSVIAVLKALFHSDRFILGGGGLLQESSGPLNHLYYLSLLFLAKLCRCFTEVVALGVDPTRHMFNRFLTRVVLNTYADRISVRDEESRQVLHDLGVTKTVSVVSDPVTELPVASAPQPKQGIALALSGKMHEIPMLRAWIEESVRQRSISIDLLVLFPREDALLAETLKAACRGVKRVRSAQDPMSLLEWIPEYELVIASRFHALVLAASSGVPFIGWGNQKKVESFCKKHGMPYFRKEHVGS